MTLPIDTNSPIETATPSATGRRVLLIVNARSRQGADAARDAERLLVERGLMVLPRECVDRADMGNLIRGHAGEVDGVVIGGGDGTINAAALALAETGLPLGILPLGTANDLARTLELPVDIAGAADVIAAGRSRTVDLGMVNGQPFFNVASLGLSVDLTRELTPERKRRWGKLGYALATIRVLSRARPFRAEIIADGETYRVKTVQIAVGNGRYYGAGLTVEERATIDDGKFDVYSLEVRHPWHLALIYPAFRLGRQGRWSDVRTITCEQVEIRTSRPRSINTDGELTVRTPAKFTLRRRAVRVYAP